MFDGESSAAVIRKLTSRDVGETEKLPLLRSLIISSGRTGLPPVFRGHEVVFSQLCFRLSNAESCDAGGLMESEYWDTMDLFLKNYPTFGRQMPKSVIKTLQSALERKGAKDAAMRTLNTILQQTNDLRVIGFEDLLIFIAKLPDPFRKHSELELSILSLLGDATKRAHLLVGNTKKSFQTFVDLALLPCMALIESLSGMTRQCLFHGIQLSDIFLDGNYFQVLFVFLEKASEQANLIFAAEFLLREFSIAAREHKRRSSNPSSKKRKIKAKWEPLREPGNNATPESTLILSFFRKEIAALLRREEDANVQQEKSLQKSTLMCIKSLLEYVADNAVYVQAYNSLDNAETFNQLVALAEKLISRLRCSDNNGDAASVLVTLVDRYYEVLEDRSSFLLSAIGLLHQPEQMSKPIDLEGNSHRLIAAVIRAMGLRRQILEIFTMGETLSLFLGWEEFREALTSVVRSAPLSQLPLSVEALRSNALHKSNRQVVFQLLSILFSAWRGRILTKSEAITASESARKASQELLSVLNNGSGGQPDRSAEVMKSALELSAIIADTMLYCSITLSDKTLSREARVIIQSATKVYNQNKDISEDTEASHHRCLMAILSARIILTRLPRVRLRKRKNLLLRRALKAVLIDLNRLSLGTTEDAVRYSRLLKVAFELSVVIHRTAAYGRRHTKHSHKIRTLFNEFTEAVIYAVLRGSEYGGDAIFADDEFYEAVGSVDLIISRVIGAITGTHHSEELERNAGDAHSESSNVQKLVNFIEANGSIALQLLSHLPLTNLSSEVWDLLLETAMNFHARGINCNDEMLKAACLDIIREGSRCNIAAVVNEMTVNFRVKLLEVASQEGLEARQTVVCNIMHFALSPAGERVRELLLPDFTQSIIAELTNCHQGQIACAALEAISSIGEIANDAQEEVRKFSLELLNYLNNRSAALSNSTALDLCTGLVKASHKLLTDADDLRFNRNLMETTIALIWKGLRSDDGQDHGAAIALISAVFSKSSLTDGAATVKLVAQLFYALDCEDVDTLRKGKECVENIVMRASSRQELLLLLHSTAVQLDSTVSRRKFAAVRMAVYILRAMTKGLGGSKRRLAKLHGVSLSNGALRGLRALGEQPVINNATNLYQSLQEECLQATILLVEKEDLFSIHAKHVAELLSFLPASSQSSGALVSHYSAQLIGALFHHRTAICRMIYPCLLQRLSEFLREVVTKDASFATETSKALERFEGSASASSLKRYAAPILSEFLSSAIDSDAKRRKLLMPGISAIMATCTEKDFAKINSSLNSSRKRAFKELYEEHNNSIRFCGKV